MEVPSNTSGITEDARTASLLALILELYRAAQETPTDEFPELAAAMAGALGPPGTDLADHLANAMRLNRALNPGPRAARLGR